MATALVEAPSRVVFEATPVQDRLWEVVQSVDQWLLGFGGGIRGTKTWGTLAVLIILCRVYPKSRWYVVRKDLERLKDSTLPAFQKLADLFPGFVGAINRQDWYARCRNGSEIHFTGENIDRDPELSRFHGLEASGFLLDDADELSERTFIKSIERAGSWIVPDGPQPPPYVFVTFNPCPNWPRRRFYAPWKAGHLEAPYAFIPSTQADNPYVSDAQREAWKAMSEAEYRRFILGDWDALQGAYYDTLDPAIHLIERTTLPSPLPSYWAYWGSYDWGYRHWAVCCAWATDTDGTDYLLDTVWIRKAQDAEQANAFTKDLPAPCLRTVYAGHDAFNKPMARSADGVSTAEVFAQHGVTLVRAHIDPVDTGRSVGRAFAVKDGKSSAYVVRTPGNLRVWDQLTEVLPDANDVRRPRKTDADENGIGGDDGHDAARYGLGSRHQAGKAPVLPADFKQPDRARPIAPDFKRGRYQPPPPYPTSLDELAERLRGKRGQDRVPFQTHLPESD